MHPIMMVVGNLGYGGVAISGAILAIRGMITIGDIQAFIQYVKNFTQPIQQIAQVINQVQSMTAASERVFEFLNEEEERADYRKSCDFKAAERGRWSSATFVSDTIPSRSSSGISARKWSRVRRSPL